ncbi:hypothetical protein KIPB_006025, partial [Kipferlia bialata]|eukprot:g6025.t1
MGEALKTTPEALSHSIWDDSCLMSKALTDMVDNIIPNALAAVSAFVMASSRDWRAAVFGVASMPIQALAISWYRTRSSKSLSVHRAARAGLGAAVSSSLSRLPLVRAYGGEAYEVDSVGQAQQKLSDIILVRGKDLGVLSVVQTNCKGLSAAATVSVRCAERLGAHTERDVEQGSPDPSLSLSGSLDVDRVHFGYNKDTLVLKDLSFSIPAGATAAIVGRSGSAGKSTLVRLLMRFYDPSRGSISLGGRDIRKLNIGDLRRHIAVVHQDSPVVPGSALTNIVYPSILRDMGDDERERALSRATECASQANCLEFLSDRGGMEETLGQLSGGQRQRLAIARALYRDAPVLILDESTSSLDTENQAQVQAAVEKASLGRTLIIIAHRLSTVRGADL